CSPGCRLATAEYGLSTGSARRIRPSRMPSRPCAAGCGRDGFLQYPVITRPFQNSAARFGPCCCTPWPRQREVGKRAEVELSADHFEYITYRGRSEPSP